MSITEQFCQDCLKTKQFIITISLVVTTATIGALSTVGLFSEIILPPNTLNIIGFTIGWSIVTGGAILFGFLSYCFLYDYCDKIGGYYKSNTYIILFGITTTVTLLVVSIGAIHFQENYNHWVVIHESSEPEFYQNKVTHVIVGQYWNIVDGKEYLDKKFVKIDEYCINNPDYEYCPVLVINNES